MCCDYKGCRQSKNLDKENYCLQHLTNKEKEKLKNDNKLINIFE